MHWIVPILPSLVLCAYPPFRFYVRQLILHLCAVDRACILYSDYNYYSD